MHKTKKKNYVSTFSFQPFGIQGAKVFIECNVILALPQLSIIGITSSQALMMRERIVNSLSANGISLPDRRITVSIRSDAPILGVEGFDLAVTIAVLACLQKIPANTLPNSCFLGALGLNGDLHPVLEQQSLSVFLQNNSFKQVFFPMGTQTRVPHAISGGAFESLGQVLSFLRGERIDIKREEISFRKLSKQSGASFLALKGQEDAKRAAAIVAAGGHHFLIRGPRGAGKSSICSALRDLLPDPSECEWNEILAIYSGMGKSAPKNRPFRVPHFSATKTALIGGGARLQPGECTLAHNGILFLDELLEFPKDVLEQLRIPLESGKLQLSRAMSSVELPAKFQLIAATNLSPCGLLGHPLYTARSSHTEIARYQKRLSESLRDRIDVQIDIVPETEEVLLYEQTDEKHYMDLRKQINLARKRMLARQNIENARLGSDVLQDRFGWTDSSRQVLAKLCQKRILSNRAMLGVAKVARTVADLGQREEVTENDLHEAINYRVEIES